MSDKSTIPTIDSFMGDPDYEMPSNTRKYTIEVWLRSTISHYMKAYGEAVRKETLKLASEEAGTMVDWSSNGEAYERINRDSILSLENDDRLKIQ